MEEGARKRKIKYTKLSLTKSKSNSSSENLGKTASTQISQFFRKNKSENGIIEEETELPVVETNNYSEAKIIEPKIRRSTRTVKKLPDPNPNKETTKFLSKKSSVDDDESDFHPKKKKIFTPVKDDKTPPVRKSRAKKQPDIRKALKRNSKNDELDPEHLQMAIALSRSLLETKGDNETLQEETTIGVNTKRTLAEFGFKSKSALNKDYSSMMGFDGKVPKWMKKCTRLTRRNPDIQKKLIEEKVQILLSEEFLEHPYYEKTDRNYKATSVLLKNYYSKENKTFFKNSLEQKSSIIFDSYYVSDLVPKSNTSVGCLLRDWSKIPGRDLSPERLDIDLVYFPTQKLYTQKESSQEIAIQDEPKSSKINHEKVEEEESYLFSESESEVEVEVSNRDDEKISSAKSECSQNNVENMEIEKTSLTPELIEISSEESVRTIKAAIVENLEPVSKITLLDKPESISDYSRSQEQMEVELDDSLIVEKSIDSIPEIISSIESKTTSKSSGILRGIENSPEKMEIQLEQEKENSVKSIRVPSPDMFSDLEDSISSEPNENIEDQTIIYPFEHYAAKELPSFSQIANSIVIDNSSADESIEENEIKHYEKYNSEEAKIGNNNSIIVLSDDEEEIPEEVIVNKTPDEEILYLTSTDAISLNSVALTYTKNTGLTKIFEKSFSFSEDENEQIDLTQDDGVISPQSKIDDMISKIDSILSNKSLAEEELLLSDEEINFSIRKGNTTPEKLSQSDFDDFDVLIHGNEDNILEESILENSKGKNLLEESLTEILNKSDLDEIPSKEFKRFRSETQFNRSHDFHYPDFLLDEEEVEIVPTEEPKNEFQISQNKVIEFLSKTFETEYEIETDLYTIKTKNVQSKPDYKDMTLAQLTEELKKFGLKKLSRQRAVFILDHIYKQTHPVFNEINGNLFIEEEKKTKIKSPKRKVVKNKISSSQPTCSKYLDLETNELSQNTEISPEENFSANLLVDDGTCAEIENEEYFLPSKPRGKMNSCAVPVHIAFYNKAKSDKKLRESILCYEPINLDKLYLFFKGIGLRYEPNDLISFLDSRCITFRTFKNQKKDRKKNQNRQEL